MKRFYQLLLIVTALVSGNMFGMEEKIDINRLINSNYVVGQAHFVGFINTDELDCINVARQKVNKLNAIIQKVDKNPLNCTDDELDLIMIGVQIFDRTIGYLHVDYESLFCDTLGAIINAKNAKGLTFQMQPWENIILQRGANLQGWSKKYVDVLRQKEKKQQELQVQADNVAFRIFIELSLIVESPDGQCEKLDTLLQDELGADASFGNYLDYINIKIREVIQDPIMAGDKEAQLNNLWNTKFNTLFVQEYPQQQDLEYQQLQIEQQEKALELKSEQIYQANQEHQPKSTLADLLNQYKTRNVNLPDQQNQNQPDIEGGQPRPDAPNGLESLCAAAPKLAIMAVVVGVGYWGYTKYTAYKEAQESEKQKQESAAVETMADKEEQKEAGSKHNAYNKQSVRK